MSLAAVAPAQAQSLCVRNYYNQVVCGQPSYNYGYGQYNGRPNPYRDGVRRDVRDIYRDVLDREADRGGLRDWSRDVRQGGDSLNDVRRGIAESEEAKDRINDIYRNVLGRDADSDGMRTWTNELKDGASLNEVRRQIENSEEARRRNGRWPQRG